MVENASERCKELLQEVTRLCSVIESSRSPNSQTAASTTLNSLAGPSSAQQGGASSSQHGGSLSALQGSASSSQHGGSLSALQGSASSSQQGGSLSALQGGASSSQHGGSLSTQQGSASSSQQGGSLSAQQGGASSGQLTRPLNPWQEHRRLFGFQASDTPTRKRKNPGNAKSHRPPKNKKEPTLTRKFVCLADKNSVKVPTPGEYVKLKKASLGEKKITLLLADTCHNVDMKLKREFPKLDYAGGYAMACSNVTRHLERLTPPYSATRLKEATGQGKIFILPLQRNLDISPSIPSEEEMEDDLLEICFKCNNVFYLHELSTHLESCREHFTVEVESSDSENEVSATPGGTRRFNVAIPSATSTAAIPSATSTAAIPSATSTAATPSATSTAATPSATSTAATPSATSTAATPSATSTAAIPSATSTAAIPSATSTAAIPSATSTAAIPSATSTAAIPSATSTAATPSATSTAATPSATSTAAIPSATSTAATPSATSTAVTPSATSTAAIPSATNTAAIPSATSTAATPSATSTAAIPSATSTAATPSATSTAVTPSATSTGAIPSATSTGATPSATSTGATPSAINEDDADLQVPTFGREIQTANSNDKKSVDQIAQTVVDYCLDEGIHNPVEVLRCAQKFINTGRKLEVQSADEAQEGETNFLIVDRENILDTAFDEIEALTDLRKTLEVQFYNEDAQDYGGPRKEFFRLCLTKIKETYFDNGLRELMRDKYTTVGVILGLSIIQNGPLPRFLSLEILEDVFMNENLGPCLQELQDGLKKTGIHQVGSRLPIFLHLLKPGPQSILTVRKLISLLEPLFSESGSNRRAQENAVYSQFVKYLREAASGRRNGVTLAHILRFTTGADEEPVLGFVIKPSISFFEAVTSFLPTANTCISCLKLPRPSLALPLPPTTKLFDLYDLAFSNAYFGNV